MSTGLDAVTGREVLIPTGGVELPGSLVVPPSPLGVVLFAHGAGSSRMSPRNRLVAGRLHEARIATLLFDLLTAREAVSRTLVFDIPLLSDRLIDAVGWIGSASDVGGLPTGLFGASTGAAAALVAAARLGDAIGAVVSRGGRPDLADADLPRVRAPTLLLVGGRDEVVLDLNRQAFARLGGRRELIVVPGATHLFEEPGALEIVADHAARWFAHYLDPAARSPASGTGRSG